VSSVTTEILLDGLAFPEGPRWHEGRLWFSDQHTGRVVALSVDGTHETIVEVPNGPSGLGWLPDGQLLVVSMRDRRLLRFDGTSLSEVADLTALAPFHCNDMVVDAHGRAYIGNFGFDLDGGGAYQTTVLVRVDPDGSATVVADELAFPNGAVITPDGTTLIIGETFAGRLTAFTILADGSLTDRRAWAEITGAAPDGCCLDADGAVWVADPMGRRVVRVLEGGEVTDTVTVGAPNSAYACALGGADGKTLFICSASTSTPEVAVEQMGGRIETVDVAVRGAVPSGTTGA
jgi:sugar lactone lactonase YvrE